MWGLIRFLAVIGALTGAAVTASTLVAGLPRLPEWLPWAALFLGALMVAASMLLEQLRFGRQPDWKQRMQLLPRWARVLTPVVTTGFVLLAVYTNFTSGAW